MHSPENSRAGAQAYETVLRQKLARGEDINQAAQTAERGQTFEQFAWEWLDKYATTNNKYSEQRNKRIILQASLIPFFGAKTISDIDAYDIECYKAKLLKDDGLSPKTVRNRLTVLHTCLSKAYEWLKIAGSVPKVTWPKVQPPKTDFLSPDECELLLNNTSGLMREMVLMTLRTGMRQGELKGLQWQCINWATQTITVQYSLCDYTKELTSPKSNKARQIPIDTDIYEMLFARKRETGFVFKDEHGQPFDNKRLNRQLENACKRAQLRRITWHTLRHTFASQLAINGTPLHVVQGLLGHSSITTTMRYSHVASADYRSAINMLNPKSMLNADFGQPVGNRWQETRQKELVRKSPSAKDD